MDIDKLEKSQDVEGLIAALRATDADGRRAAARSLGQLRDGRAFQPLVEVFLSPDEDQGVRQVTALALGWLGDERAVEPLIDVLQRSDDNGEVRRFAADAVGELGSSRAVEPLISLVQSSDDDFVRQLAGVGLGKLGDRRAVGALTDALRSGVHVAEALGKLGDPRAVEPLLEVATRSEYHIGLRFSAVNALGDLGDAGAIEGLRSLLADEDFSEFHTDVRGALETLGALAKPERPEDLTGAARERALSRKAEYREAALAWWGNNDRSEAICDDCNTTIPRPEGYLRPGYLACERCTDRMVSGYYN